MDRALVERMVGAVVLVLLFVWLAPALLDGRDEPGAGDLPGNRQEGLRTVVIQRNEPVSPVAPEPAKPASPGASTPKTAQQSAPSKVESEAVSTAKTGDSTPISKSANEAPDRGFAVQLGSFSSRDNAVSYARTLRKSGYDIFVVKGRSGEQSVYRVFAGPEASRSRADKLASRLKSEGQSVLVVDLAGG